ncbi:hypothetical protein PPACK8108_LOCUS22226 [Phakopsora pachyrhizi]|uniref:Uncharacterized protein n=1 Tax=Phakopsora pachyrhizi TaxID=170000 RepID=A0AAV0BM64_PHAPC|nr:hypothetical protein PPACK8108_LOCUS22226 [Phakopsora pachyrhizi]
MKTELMGGSQKFLEKAACLGLARLVRLGSGTAGLGLGQAKEAGLGLGKLGRKELGLVGVSLGQAWKNGAWLGWWTAALAVKEGLGGQAQLLSAIERQASRKIDCNLPWCCKEGKQAGFAGLGRNEDWLQHQLNKRQTGLRGLLAVARKDREGWAWSRAGQAGLGRVVLGLAGLGLWQYRDSWRVAMAGLGRVVLGLAGLGLWQYRDSWRAARQDRDSWAWSKAGQGGMEGRTAGFGLAQAWLLSGFERQAQRRIDYNLPWHCKGGKQAGRVYWAGAEEMKERAGWADAGVAGLELEEGWHQH